MSSGWMVRKLKVCGGGAANSVCLQDKRKRSYTKMLQNKNINKTLNRKFHFFFRVRTSCMMKLFLI